MLYIIYFTYFVVFIFKDSDCILITCLLFAYMSMLIKQGLISQNLSTEVFNSSCILEMMNTSEAMSAERFSCSILMTYWLFRTQLYRPDVNINQHTHTPSPRTQSAVSVFHLELGSGFAGPPSLPPFSGPCPSAGSARCPGL